MGTAGRTGGRGARPGPRPAGPRRVRSPPGPPGVEAYAETVGAVIEALDFGPAVLVGHSLAAAVAVTLAARRPAPDVVRLAMEEIRSCRLQTLRRDIAAARTMDVHALAPAVEVPALVIVGLRDALTPPALSVALGQAIPHARVTIVEGAGHMVHLEAPGRVNGEIRALVASVPARAEPGPRRPGLGTVRRLSRRAIGWLRQRWRRGPGW